MRGHSLNNVLQLSVRTDGASGQVKLMTNFPKKVFSDDDYDNSLENLGLVPSAVLMMTK